MSVYFFDSSALVKRYVQENGSEWVRQATALQKHVILVSRITYVEVLSAFARLQREGKIDSTAISTTRDLFEYDWTNQYQIIEFDQGLADIAGRLVQTYPLRAYDSIQLASALTVHSFFSKIDPKLLVFVSADDRLLAVAATEKIVAENPNNY